ncbi:unnamed protein product, partial [Mesorhabditis belari]|uniref:TFIIS N-terminal domain-containing protein n=1 Tax=Mesorhabditis belari TaxID=2138241 RepID=A0AAF3FBL3_9BILA
MEGGDASPINRTPSPRMDDVDAPSSQPHSPDASQPQSPIDEENAPLSPTSDAPESPYNDYQPNEQQAEEPSTSPKDADDNSSKHDEKQVDKNDEDQASPVKSKSMSPPASPASSHDEEEPKISPKKRRILSSDDESDGVSDKDEAQQEDKDSDTESPVKKRRAIFGSDDEDSEDEGDKNKNKSDSDSSKSPKSGDEETAKDLVENIFGGSDDEKEEDKPVDDDDEDMPKRGPKDEDGFEWDFDVMMRQKKAEKKRSRKRKSDGFDLINDDDGQVARLVESMKQAAKEDRHSNVERRPALKKRKLLPTVKNMLLRLDMMEAMLDGGMMSILSEWLAPLPDKSLPCLEIRTSLLKLLQSYRLEQGTLRQSGLGKAVMMLFKHPKETKDNKLLAQRLIGEWARPIFNLTTDFASLSRDERIQRDYEHMPENIKRRRESHEAGPSTSQDSEGNTLAPGDKGFIGRARVPKISKTDYVVRPKSNVEGEFKGAGKRELGRMDRAARDFKERTRKTKFGRAVGVSIEGRRMEI